MPNQQLIEAAKHAVAVFRSLGERGAYPQELLPDDSNGKPSDLYMGKQGFMFLIKAIEAAEAEDAAAAKEDPRPPVTWRQLGDWYNLLYHGSMYIDERQYGNGQYALDKVIAELEVIRNAQGDNESFKSLADREVGIRQ
jgi:hypothetical protein